MVTARDGLDSSLTEQRFVTYIRVSLRRYASRWRGTLGRRVLREMLVPLNQPAVHDDGGIADLIIPRYPSAENAFLASGGLDDLIANRSVFQAFQSLTPHQRLVVIRLVIQGDTQQAVARDFQVTQQAVFRTKQQALRRLRMALGT